MNDPVRLCLVLHNHQPVGNFHGVIEQAYRESYLPFLDVLESYPQIRVTLHTSGPLLQWFIKHRPEYIQRMRALVASGQVEVLGGPIYESILTMLPSRDRLGQIFAFSRLLEDTFETKINGMWVPERVWESQLTSDVVQAGMQYTVLDDFHFMAAGLPAEDLAGHFLTEEDGRVLRIFAGCERLRYLIPFAEVEQTLEYARQVQQTTSGAVLVCGDDGEKFGSWPNTHQHVYQHGWLRRFFDALVANSDWLKCLTLAQAVSQTQPLGKIYLPDCSYREMTQWALPPAQQVRQQALVQEFQDHPHWERLKPFLRAGNWRNFKSRYTEANEMYSRMMQVSKKLDDAGRSCGDAELLYQIEDHLYRGQCNCAYWHGTFGGIYLPHLRGAIYSELIAADNQLDYLEHGPGPWVEAYSDDFNFDLQNEVRLANDEIVLYVAPAQGGMIYELDLREQQHNLLATMQRRPEAYHQSGHASCAKSAGCLNQSASHGGAGCQGSCSGDKCCDKPSHEYDLYPRKSFLEHFYDNDANLTAVASGQAIERGDFVAGSFEARLRRAASKIQLQMCRDGNAWGVPFRITKALTIQAGSSQIEAVYLIEGLPQDRTFHLALEWNFAGLPAGADDRFFYDAQGQRLGHLGSKLDLDDTEHLSFIDCWLGIDVQMRFDRPTQIWSFPIETISQNEAGVERVHQSISVQPHWLISGDHEGKWSLHCWLKFANKHQPSAAAHGVALQYVAHDLAQYSS